MEFVFKINTLSLNSAILTIQVLLNKPLDITIYLSIILSQFFNYIVLTLIYLFIFIQLNLALNINDVKTKLL
jgi:hypothetical protein